MSDSIKPKRRWLSLSLAALLLLVAGIISLRAWYNHNLSPLSDSQKTAYFTVNRGSGVNQIGRSLEQMGLIRNSYAFETYVRSNELHDELQAGTYNLSPSMSVQQIVAKMTSGEVSRNLFTILPGQRLDQIKKAFVKAGYSRKEVESALKPSKYADHPALAQLPKGASLEGYLYPDSYQKLATTPVSTIVEQALSEFDKHLSNQIVDSLAKRGLSVHQGVTLASVVYKESDNPIDERTIAQVFYSRLKADMPLQSDPTAYYSADIVGDEHNLRYDSPYNTYIHPGLPPGPISNFDKSALTAVASPSKSNYLFFVSGDDDKTYFSKTQAEHEAKVRKYCQRKCAL